MALARTKVDVSPHSTDLGKVPRAPTEKGKRLQPGPGGVAEGRASLG